MCCKFFLPKLYNNPGSVQAANNRKPRTDNKIMKKHNHTQTKKLKKKKKLYIRENLPRIEENYEPIDYGWFYNFHHSLKCSPRKTRSCKKSNKKL